GAVHRLGLLERSEQVLRATRVVPVLMKLFENPSLPLEVTLAVRGPSFGAGEMLQKTVAVHGDYQHEARHGAAIAAAQRNPWARSQRFIPLLRGPRGRGRP